VAVWVTGDPAAEDVLTLRANAYGPGGSRRSVELTVRRVPLDAPEGEAGDIQRVFWRER